jgi:hypothetical protein
MAEGVSAELPFRPVRQHSQKPNKIDIYHNLPSVIVRLQPPETAKYFGDRFGDQTGGRHGTADGAESPIGKTGHVF